MGHFYYAAKAFDIMERLDSEREYEDALRGAVVGMRKTKIFEYYLIKFKN